MRTGKKLLVAATMAVALTGLAACGSSGSTSGSSAGGSAGASSSEIDFWHIQTTGDGPKLIQDAVNRFEADNPGVKVNISPVANDAYKDKLKVALGANSAPCIFPTWGGGPLADYVKAGQVVDLSSYVNANSYKDRFLPASWTNVTFDDKVYGVPVENSAVAVIWYNKKVFEKYGLTPPTTWDDFTKVANTLKANGVAPIALANKPKWPGIMWYDYLVTRFGGNEAFAKAALRKGGAFTDQPFIQAGDTLTQMVNDGWFAPGFNSTDYDSGGARKLLYSGKAAMQLMGNWEYGNFVADKQADNFGFFPFPSVNGGAGDPSELLGTIGDNFYSVSATCKDPAAAFKVIQYLIDDTSVKARVAAGRIPPVKGLTLTDPVSQDLAKLMAAAKSVQLWWDQYMPAEFAQLHLNQVQSLMGKSTTSQDMAQKQEDLANKLLGPSSS